MRKKLTYTVLFLLFAFSVSSVSAQSIVDQRDILEKEIRQITSGEIVAEELPETSLDSEAVSVADNPEVKEEKTLPDDISSMFSETEDTENIKKFDTAKYNQANHAVLRGLDKMTGRVNTVYAPVGDTFRFGSLSVIVRVCLSRSPEETPEDATFLDISEIRQGEPAETVFRGWMFSSSPALSAMEHPIYDIWVIGCKNMERQEPVLEEPSAEENQEETSKEISEEAETIESDVSSEELAPAE